MAVPSSLFHCLAPKESKSDCLTFLLLLYNAAWKKQRSYLPLITILHLFPKLQANSKPIPFLLLNHIHNLRD